MVINFERRDIGFTIISRLEIVFREYINEKLDCGSLNLEEVLPMGIINKAKERSGRVEFEDSSEILEESDFIDLLDVCLYKQNFKTLFPGSENGHSKDWLKTTMSDLYTLRCKIAHVKGFFSSLDLDRLIELSREISKVVDTNENLSKLLYNIEREPQEFILKTPLSFSSEPAFSKTILNNLPTPDYELDGGFVGRENDIKNIISLIEKDKFPVVTITGAGGVGKTSLALKVIYELIQRPMADNLDAIIWLSAKENRLSVLGIEELEPSLKSYEELLDTIIEVAGFSSDNVDNSTEEKEQLANEIIDLSNNVIIVVDNLETVTDERIINFIIDSSTKAKFLVTSRKGIGQVERRVELKQLKEKEAIYLFRQVAKIKKLEHLSSLSEDIIKKYVIKVSCYPLAIKWVLGQVARGRDINFVIDSIDEATSDISKFCFEQIFNLLPIDCKRILYSLCCFDDSPPAGLLQFVVDIDQQIFEDSIEELILVSLIIPEQYTNEQGEIGRKFSLLPLTKGYIRQQLSKDLTLKNIIEEKIAKVQDTVAEAERAKREYRFSLRNLGAKTEEEKLAALMVQTALHNHQAGKYEEAIENYKRAIKAAPRFSSIYRNWAVMESVEGHLMEAERLMEKAESLNSSDPQIWLFWGNIKRNARNHKEALEKYEKAYKLLPNDHVILNAYGQARGFLGDHSGADELLNLALQSDEIVTSKKHEIINRTCLAENLINWSDSLIRDRNYEDAQNKLQEAKKHCDVALKIDSSDKKTKAANAKVLYKLGRLFRIKGDQLLGLPYLIEVVRIQPEGFKETTYKIKATIELCNFYREKGSMNLIEELLTPLQNRNHKIFQRHPSLLVEVNELLDLAKGNHTIEGYIIRVNEDRGFVIIGERSNDARTYIAHKNNFIPSLTNVSNSLKGKQVRFNNFINTTDESKLKAKNVMFV